MSRISAVRSTTLILQLFLQVAQLARGELAVADHRVGAGRRDDLGQLDDLARPDVRARIGMPAALHHRVQHHRPCRLGEPGEFGHRRLGRRPQRCRAGPHPDQHHPLELQLAVLDLGDVGSSVDRPTTRRSAARSSRSCCRGYRRARPRWGPTAPQNRWMRAASARRRRYRERIAEYSYVSRVPDHPAGGHRLSSRIRVTAVPVPDASPGTATIGCRPGQGPARPPRPARRQSDRPAPGDVRPTAACRSGWFGSIPAALR